VGLPPSRYRFRSRWPADDELREKLRELALTRGRDAGGVCSRCHSFLMSSRAFLSHSNATNTLYLIRKTR